METILIAITVLSLGLALGMSVVAWRSSQEQKRLAAARVAALAAAAQVPPPADVNSEPKQPWRRPDEAGLAAFASERADLRPDAPASAIPASIPSLPTSIPTPAEIVPPASVPVQSGFLGAEPAVRESATHQRWLAAAAVVLAIVLGSVVYARMTGAGSTSATAQVQAAATPLELLSLRHEREGVNLSVSGLVRNPQTGAVVERLTAMVYLFDQQGTFVTSAKAPIDFLKLTAGDESPFVVKVAAPLTVARYRVSFRTDEGGTLPHVDRRGEPPVTAPVSLARE